MHHKQRDFNRDWNTSSICITTWWNNGPGTSSLAIEAPRSDGNLVDWEKSKVNMGLVSIEMIGKFTHIRHLTEYPENKLVSRVSAYKHPIMIVLDMFKKISFSTTDLHKSRLNWTGKLLPRTPSPRISKGNIRSRRPLEGKIISYIGWQAFPRIARATRKERWLTSVLSVAFMKHVTDAYNPVKRSCSSMPDV